jgi:hypothetical protein
MGYYIVQKEEKEIDFDLYEALSKSLVAEAGMHITDAKIRMRLFYGILNIPEEEQAKKVSEHFQELGLDNFVLAEDELLELPEMELLSEDCLEEITEPDLFAAGRIFEEIKEVSTRFNPFKQQFAPGSFGGNMLSLPRPIPGTAIEKRVRTKRQTTYCVDAFTRQRHWRIARGWPPRREIEILESLISSEAYLNQGMKSMLEGQINIISFEKQEQYNSHLTWLFQMRYAQPN